MGDPNPRPIPHLHAAQWITPASGTTQWNSKAAYEAVARTCHEITLRCQKLIAMHTEPRRPGAANRSHDGPEHARVGDSDPTATHQYPTCGFEWIDDGDALTLHWSCTRRFAHHGRHLAGTGQWVVAVHPGRPRPPQLK
jgi:hypothetical protein